MAIPHKRWYSGIVARSLHCIDALNVCGSKATMTNETLAYAGGSTCKVGHANYGGVYHQWRGIFTVVADDFELADGLDQVCDFGYLYEMIAAASSSGSAACKHYGYMVTDHAWEPGLVSGKHYDGVHDWTAYWPQSVTSFDIQDYNIASMPSQKWNWIEAYQVGHRGNQYQDELFDGYGIMISDENCDSCLPCAAGEEEIRWIRIREIHVNYLNPIVNSLSRMNVPAAGGVQLILYGLGFDQDPCELSSASRFSGNGGCGVAWNSLVDWIYFIGQQGQGTITLSRALGDFTVVSDTEIIINSIPALTVGTYHIRLRKQNVGVAGAIGDVYGYAGDWRADESGLCHPGSRFTLFVGDSARTKPPGLFFKWKWKLGGLAVDEYYAPIDIRGPDTFWEGRVLSVGSMKRSIDDFTGMYSISDMNVSLASADKHFQQNLALGHCKNQVVEVYEGWLNEPVGWHEAFFFGIVDDYTPAGPVFDAVLKDVSRRNFRKQMPRYTITTDEYPNAHPDAVGQGIPELLGQHSWTTAPTPGAIEALCINTVTHQYIAAAAPITIQQVYSNNNLQTEGAGNDYTISYDVDGRTYIDFNADQGDNKITFNCGGYSFAPWDSANGYIQNPVRILEFFMAFLNEVPIDFINTESFDTLADQFEDNGYGEIGRLACTEVEETDGYLQELLFSFGIKMWPDRYGRFKVGRKDLTNYETDRTIWAQIDTVEAPSRPYNLKEAINYVKARSDYQPACSMWRIAVEREWGGAVEDYEQRNEGAWDYPWITGEDFLVERIAEDLGRLAYGRRTVTFSMPMDAIDDLDIFDNFKLQDPYGISASGAGNIGRYYYVTALDYDWMGHKITVEAEDLQWLVGQCFLIGHCDDIPELWASASDWQQMFGYIGSCDTDSMPDGQPLKKICSCG